MDAHTAFACAGVHALNTKQACIEVAKAKIDRCRQSPWHVAP